MSKNPRGKEQVLYRPMLEQRCYLLREQLDQRLADQLEEEQRLAALESSSSDVSSRGSMLAGSTRPLPPMGASSSGLPGSPLDDGGQLDLAGGEVPLGPGPHVQPSMFAVDGFVRRGGRVLGSRYHSPAWDGTVVQATIDGQEGG